MGVGDYRVPRTCLIQAGSIATQDLPAFWVDALRLGFSLGFRASQSHRIQVALMPCEEQVALV